MKITKELLIDWIDRPPSNIDFRIITYIINLQNNRDKAIEYVEHHKFNKFGDIDCNEAEDIIDILKGDSDE